MLSLRSAFQMVANSLTQALAEMPKLEILHLEQSKFCPKISNRGNFGISNRGIEFFDGRRMELVELNFSRSEIQNLDLEEICRHCPNVERLQLNHCQELSEFSPIANLERLTILELQQCRINSETLQKISERCEKVQKLKLLQCAVLHDFQSLSAFSFLKHLSIGPNRSFDDFQLIGASHAGFLEYLSIRDCRSITDFGVDFVAKNSPNLSVVDLSGLNHVTDLSVVPLIENCKKLKYLALSASGISSGTLAAVGNFGNNLKRLIVENCPDLRNDGFQALISGRKEKILEGIPLPTLTMHVGGREASPVPQDFAARLKEFNVVLMKTQIQINWRLQRAPPENIS